MTGRETGNENTKIGRDWIVFLLMLVVDLYALFGQHRHVTDVILISVVKLTELDRVIQFFHLGFVGFLPEFTPHRVEHHFGQGL